MGKLVLFRDENMVFGAMASYNIYLDSKLIGEIKNGDKLSFDIPNGVHRLYIRNNRGFTTKLNVLSFESSDTSVTNILVKVTMARFFSGVKIDFLDY